MQKVVVVGAGSVKSDVLEALRKLGFDAEHVDKLDDTMTRLVNTVSEMPTESFLIEDRDRHMKNSPYPAKKRGKGKRNKY